MSPNKQSAIDYGCIGNTPLMTIDVMQTQPLGIYAFSAAMNVEISEMPLEVRQQQVAMDYWVSLKGLSLFHELGTYPRQHSKYRKQNFSKHV